MGYKKATIKVEFEGKEMLLMNLLKKLDRLDDQQLIKSRIYNGWNINDALNLPKIAKRSKRHNGRITFNEELCLKNRALGEWFENVVDAVNFLLKHLSKEQKQIFIKKLDIDIHNNIHNLNA